ncbi:MAG: CBS domain-containing protein, partial [Desulfovibrionales bacterium]|nr:CBS domain-containing protein [Desulfovibrionales bacterium]
PVIMLTGHGGLASAKQARSEGAFDYLSKPCDINLLADKINEACSLGGKVDVDQEKKVRDLMIPIESYTVINGDETLGEAIRRVRETFTVKLATDSIMETGHRSVLIRDKKNRIQGVLAIRDMLRVIMPSYLHAPKPNLAESIEYSPIFWDGMFTMGVRQMETTCIKDFMSPLPESIDGESNPMEAAHMMIASNHRRLLVDIEGEIRGIVREQDLFFEMDRLLKS